MPESTGAGCNRSVTFSPVCREVPETLAALARVCWGSEDISRLTNKDYAG
jgi:hypothetical protein